MYNEGYTKTLLLCTGRHRQWTIQRHASLSTISLVGLGLLAFLRVDVVNDLAQLLHHALSTLCRLAQKALSTALAVGGATFFCARAQTTDVTARGSIQGAVLGGSATHSAQGSCAVDTTGTCVSCLAGNARVVLMQRGRVGGPGMDRRLPWNRDWGSGRRIQERGGSVKSQGVTLVQLRGLV